MSEFRLSRCFLMTMAALMLASGGAVAQTEHETAPNREMAPPIPAIDSLVTAQWLSEHFEDPDLVVLDCSVVIERQQDGTMTATSGRAQYESGHIPGAGFADLLAGLSDRDSELRFAVPSPEQFAAAMGALGVGDDSRVVLYDSSNSVWAARVWWMLRWIGFDRAAILDGGLQAWIGAELPLSSEPAPPTVATLTVDLRPEVIADRDEVLAAIDDPSVHILDVLPEPHYRGEMAMYDRPGHIPSAVNIPVMALTDETGRYRDLDELAAMHPTNRDARYITYCGGGIAASASAFVMTRLGFTDVAVYTASLQEWAADAYLPMETVAVE